LLVALHEATKGLRFEQILYNEYVNIQPPEARILYLDICALHRFGPPVRAGLISRVHGISFDEFSERFFNPLENVVSLKRDPRSGDYAYEARHSYIADIVFQTVVDERQARFDLLMRLISKLNPDYSYDNDVMFHLVRARTISEWFPDRALGSALYDAAEASVGQMAGIAHQRGLYEMRIGGDRSALDRAERYLRDALKLDPTSRAIKHSLSELALRRSEIARTNLESAASRNEAARIATELASGSQSSYPFHTLAKIAIADLRDAIRAEEANPSDLATEAVADAIKQAEAAIRKGLAEFPNDSYLLSEEAELGGLLKNAVRAQRALEKAFRQNVRSELIANRLSLILASQGDLDGAITVLKKAIDANPGSRVS
jgi:tetratricopeptide (TPR) repeat protein